MPSVTSTSRPTFISRSKNLTSAARAPLRNMQSLLQRGKAFLTPSGSSTSLNASSASGFRTEKSATALFLVTNPAIDGEECLHDCASCTVQMPRKWEIDEEDSLYGHVKGWDTHLIVATDKTDWVRDVTDEKGSLMQQVGKIGLELGNGKVMLSASDMPSNNDHGHGGDHGYGDDGKTRCLVLPRWEFVEGVGTAEAKWLLEDVVAKGHINTSPLDEQKEAKIISQQQELAVEKEQEGMNGLQTESLEVPDVSKLKIESQIGSRIQNNVSPPPGVNIRACPHRAIILMCSHGTRDWRCGKSAPLLRKEFERHLRPLGLYRDIHDERPGGVGIYFINHVGGHKYSANVMIYRREGRKDQGSTDNNNVNIDVDNLNSEAVQGIWLARVRPEDCENIVRYTILQGKLVKPQRQLRGGFDRARGLTSW